MGWRDQGHHCSPISYFCRRSSAGIQGLGDSTTQAAAPYPLMFAFSSPPAEGLAVQWRRRRDSATAGPLLQVSFTSAPPNLVVVATRAPAIEGSAAIRQSWPSLSCLLIVAACAPALEASATRRRRRRGSSHPLAPTSPLPLPVHQPLKARRCNGASTTALPLFPRPHHMSPPARCPSRAWRRNGTGNVIAGPVPSPHCHFRVPALKGSAVRSRTVVLSPAVSHVALSLPRAGPQGSAVRRLDRCPFYLTLVFSARVRASL